MQRISMSPLATTLSTAIGETRRVTGLCASICRFALVAVLVHGGTSPWPLPSAVAFPTSATPSVSAVQQTVARPQVLPPMPPLQGVLVVTSDRTLTRDIQGQIEIAADNVTLDCNGHTIRDVGLAATCGVSGNDSCGIKVQNHRNVTLQHCDIAGFDIGIWISGADTVDVEYATASSNAVGYRVEDSNNVSFVQSMASRNDQEGFVVRDSVNSFFWLNTAVENGRDGFDENAGSGSYYLRNDSVYNGVNGFELDDGATPTYWENWAFGNGQHGISLDAVRNAVLYGTETVANGFDTGDGDGLRLVDEGAQGTTDCEVTDNYSAGNANNDAHQCGSLCTGNVFTNNWFVGNTNNIP